ncbi:hypothetical protein GpartN1_g4799.t1 [Galdieria partita]|uniref:Polycomb protein VEFS-Box domain-containing protein n=1 Tax=Galdieria partita TaxID=83374 RepID=A0A9C7PYB1_9RHOD|nr:hypothetical protein GpartN1_g4799.t1 [Galdieria partita]
MSRNRVEEAYALYIQMGNQWKQRNKLFLWRTHARTCTVPPRTKTWEEILDQLQRSETNEPLSNRENRQLETVKQEESFTCTIHLFDSPDSQPIKTLESVHSYCPLCLWDYQTLKNFSRHWKRIHTIFRWQLKGSNLIEGYLQPQIDIFQLLEYVDESGNPFPSCVALGWKQEQCELMTLKELVPKVGNGMVYFSTMKFARLGMDVWKMAQKTTQIAIEQVVDENIPSSSVQPMKRKERVATRKISTSPAMKKNVLESSSSVGKFLNKEKTATLNDRSYYHTVTLHPVASDEMDQDSESDYSEEWKEELEMQMLERDVHEISHRTRVFFQLWNDFVRKNRVIGDFQLPAICGQFVREHSKEIDQWNLFHPWRMHLLNLFEYGLIQRADIVKCCQPLNSHHGVD